MRVGCAASQCAVGAEPRGVKRLVQNAIANLPDGFVDRRLIHFEEFPARGVQLVAVPVEGNMAAGHHDAGFTARKGEVRQRRSRNAAGEHGPHAGITDRFFDGLPEHGRTGAEVGCDVELVARNDAAISGRQRLEVLQLSEHVHVNLELCHFGEAAPAAAGAELQFGRLPEKAGAKGHSLLVHQNNAALHLDEAGGDRHAHQGAGSVHIQLLHETVAMTRGGLECDAQVSSDLLGRFSLGNALQYLQLARRQRLELSPQSSQILDAGSWSPANAAGAKFRVGFRFSAVSYRSGVHRFSSETSQAPRRLTAYTYIIFTKAHSGGADCELYNTRLMDNTELYYSQHYVARVEDLWSGRPRYRKRWIGPSVFFARLPHCS